VRGGVLRWRGVAAADVSALGQQLNGGEKDRITEAVNIPALYTAFEDPYQDGTDGENHECQPEGNEQTRGKPAMAFLPGEKPYQFLADHITRLSAGPVAQLG
jgi:hypothetical protein